MARATATHRSHRVTHAITAVHRPCIIATRSLTGEVLGIRTSFATWDGFRHLILPQLDAAALDIAPLLAVRGEHRIPAALWERLREDFAA